MRAKPILNSKETWPDGTVVQMVVWQLPEVSAHHPHGLKYRLYCGRLGQCLVRYDNERGKGDHRHEGEREIAYRFRMLAALIEDFRNDVSRLAGEGYV